MKQWWEKKADGRRGQWALEKVRRLCPYPGAPPRGQRKAKWSFKHSLKCHFLSWPIPPKGKALLSIICWDALFNELCVRKYHQAVSKLVHNHYSLELWDLSNLHPWTMLNITIRYWRTHTTMPFWAIPTHLGQWVSGLWDQKYVGEEWWWILLVWAPDGHPKGIPIFGKI